VDHCSPKRCRAGNPSGDSSLLDLFPKVISLLADNWAVLGSVIDILEGYLLLDANTVLQVRWAIVHLPSLHSHATSTELCFSALYRTPTTFANEGVNHTRPLLDALALLLQLAHPSTYSETLHSSGLFSLLIKTIVEDKVLLSL
jgi:hypothetical protein